MLKLKIIAACLVCLATGLVLGRLIPVEPGGMRNSNISKQERLSRSTDDVSTQSEAASQWGANEHSARLPLNSGFVTSKENLVLVPSAVLTELSFAGGIRSIYDPLISRDGKIEELLGITEREKAALQTSWRESRETVRNVEAAAAISEDLEDGSVRLTLPDLTAQREATAQRFFSSVTGILGDNRGDVFLAVKQAQRAFVSQGENWSCLVATESIGDGNWRFHMTMEGTGARRVWVGETIPNEIRHITDAVGVIPSLNEDSQDP